MKLVNENPNLGTGDMRRVLTGLLREYGHAINQLIASGVSITLQAAFNMGKVIANANSFANAVRIGGDTDEKQWAIYHDSIQGPIIEPVVPSNTRARIMVNKNWGLYDVEGDSDLLIVDPDIAGAGGGLVLEMKVSSGDPTGNPPAGSVYLYQKSDGWYQKTSAGTVTKVGP